MLRVIAFLTVIASTLSAYCQEQEAQQEKSAYEQAYELLNPELYMRERARKAELLLTKGRELKSLEPRELSLLCHAYSELGERKKQLKTARQLWDREPGSRDATQWMINSLHNQYMFEDDNRPLMEFVDQALRDNKGNRRELLMFKAMATINQKKGLSDAQKRVLASDLMVKAFQHETWPSRKTRVVSPTWKEITGRDSPNFIDHEQPFCSFFSTAERNSLKMRMNDATAARKTKQSQKKER